MSSTWINRRLCLLARPRAPSLTYMPGARPVRTKCTSTVPWLCLLLIHWLFPGCLLLPVIQAQAQSQRHWPLPLPSGGPPIPGQTAARQWIPLYSTPTPPPTPTSVAHAGTHDPFLHQQLFLHNLLEADMQCLANGADLGNNLTLIDLLIPYPQPFFIGSKKGYRVSWGMQMCGATVENSVSWPALISRHPCMLRAWQDTLTPSHYTLLP